MPIDPCREWLGIDAIELVSPHLVLAVRPDETDPGVIENAAAERLRILEAVSPGPFERAHAALVSRVAEARDEMLEAARQAAVRPATPPPPVGLAPPPPPLSAASGSAWPGAAPNAPAFAPPPVPLAASGGSALPGTRPNPPPFASLEVPLPVSASTAAPYTAPTGDDSPEAETPQPVATDDQPIEQAVFVGGRRRVQPSSDSGWVVLTIAALATVAVALVAFFVISQQQRRRHAVAKHAAQPRVIHVEASPATHRHPPVRPGPRPADDRPRSAAADDSAAREPAMVEPAAPAPARRPEPEVEPAPKPEESPPAADPAKVKKSLQKAFDEIRAGRFDAAERAVNEASAAASDDLTAERIERWRLLTTYARRLAEYRDTALAEAAKGGDYNVDGTTISVIELNRTQFVYKERGAMKRPRRDAIPPRILLAILETWFRGDGRPANDIYLGVHHLLGDRPDLDAARSAWRRASQGGEDVAPLMALLTDPVLRGGQE